MRRRLVQRVFGPPAAVLFGLVMAVAITGCVNTEGEERARLFNDDGVHLFAQGDYTAALDSFDLALTLRPQDANLLFNLGQCYERLGDVKNAEKYYNTCLLRAPKHGDAHLALAELLYRTGRKAQADQMIEECLRQDAKCADAFVLDAWRLRQARAYPEAQGRLQQALDLEPHNRRALAEFALLYEATGMPQRAFVLYERILEREPGQVQISQKLDQLRTKGVSRPLPD
jgi:tetratricopeptide (TPR) repeat protein